MFLKRKKLKRDDKMKYIKQLLLSILILFIFLNNLYSQTKTSSNVHIFTDCKELLNVPEKNLDVYGRKLNLIYKPEFMNKISDDSVQEKVNSIINKENLSDKSVSFPTNTPEKVFIAIYKDEKTLIQSLYVVNSNDGMCYRAYYNIYGLLVFVEGGIVGTDKLFDIVVNWNTNNTVDRIVVIEHLNNSEQNKITEYN